ncbi:hypothetical protein [Paraburkholderia humisilvae]|uniref:hypothetical protein n=1 Tax=Paraburkholderia humisilvae TaxID=627669 RepID=UPI001584382F|nr:hypothetical protein [Paraburkholderia humisilvae]
MTGLHSTFDAVEAVQHDNPCFAMPMGSTCSRVRPLRKCGCRRISRKRLSSGVSYVPEKPEPTWGKRVHGENFNVERRSFPLAYWN